MSDDWTRFVATVPCTRDVSTLKQLIDSSTAGGDVPAPSEAVHQCERTRKTQAAKAQIALNFVKEQYRGVHTVFLRLGGQHKKTAESMRQNFFHESEHTIQVMPIPKNDKNPSGEYAQTDSLFLGHFQALGQKFDEDKWSIIKTQLENIHFNLHFQGPRGPCKRGGVLRCLLLSVWHSDHPA